MRYRILLVPILVAGLSAPASAGIIFGKKPKVVPEKRVPELLAIIKSDGDENKRYDAVEELRQYDLKQFPEIVPSLIEVLMTDAKPAVRSEAAQTLSKLRPVMPQVVPALQQAKDKDPSMRVRLQARHSLLDIQWVLLWGAKAKEKPEDIHPSTSKEPPLAPPLTPPVAPPMPSKTMAMPPLAPVTVTKPAPTIAPPLAPTIVTPPSIIQVPGNVQPLPKGPAVPPVKDEKGPDLGPQE